MTRPGPRARWLRQVAAGLVVTASLGSLLGCLLGCSVRREITLPPEPTVASPAPGPTPSDFPFPRTCAELVDPAVLNDVVSAAFTGDATRVYAGPLPSAGRTQRITCSYGVPDGDEEQPPAVQLTLNEYVDAAAAGQRQDVTLDAARTAGQEVAETAFGGQPGHLVRDDATVSAVVAVDDRTVVASLRGGLVPAAAEAVVLDGLVVAMLRLPATTAEELPDDGADPWGATDQP